MTCKCLKISSSHWLTVFFKASLSSSIERKVSSNTRNSSMRFRFSSSIDCISSIIFSICFSACTRKLRSVSTSDSNCFWISANSRFRALTSFCNFAFVSSIFAFISFFSFNSLVKERTFSCATLIALEFCFWSVDFSSIDFNFSLAFAKRSSVSLRSLVIASHFLSASKAIFSLVSNSLRNCSSIAPCASIVNLCSFKRWVLFDFVFAISRSTLSFSASARETRSENRSRSRAAVNFFSFKLSQSFSNLLFSICSFSRDFFSIKCSFVCASSRRFDWFICSSFSVFIFVARRSIACV